MGTKAKTSKTNLARRRGSKPLSPEGIASSEEEFDDRSHSNGDDDDRRRSNGDDDDDRAHS